MTRIVLIELRRSGVLWAGLTLLLSSAGLLYAARERWPSGYMILALDQRWYLSVLAGIALAAGAMQGRRDHRSRVGELFAGMPRPHLQRVVPILLVYGVAMAIAYAGATALAAVRILDTAHYLRPGAFAGVVGAGAVTVAAGAWFGLAVGRMLPYAAVPPALAIVSIASPLAALPITGRREWLSALLFPAYGLGSYTDFASVPGRFSVAQLLYLAGLAAGAALLFGRARFRSLLPPALGVVAALLILPPFVKDSIDPVAAELVCTADAPRVCVARVHSGVLDEVTPPARAALAKLARIPGGPTSAAEHIDLTQTADVLPIPLFIDDDGHLYDRDRIEGYMVRNLGVMPFVCPDNAPGPDSEVVDAASSWFLGTPASTARAQDLLEALRQLSEREAAARVATVRQAILTCAPGGDSLLTRPAI